MPIVNSLQEYTGESWHAQEQYVERVMDNAAYSSAHPDDTLVLVGPPRYEGTNLSNLAPVGMMQNFSITQTRPFQPMMAIGSGRQFFLGGKAQGSAQIGRLFVNAESLMKKLYSGYDLAGTDLSTTFTELPAAKSADNYFINLDSELFLIPFGLGCIIADKSQTVLGAFYMELSVIPSYTIGVAAGQSMILESVSILFDRIVPMSIASSQSKFDSWNKLMSGSLGDASASYETILNDVGGATATPV